MRIAHLIFAATALDACRSSQEAAASADLSQVEAVRRLSGCYVLQADSLLPYRVQLDTTRTAGAWTAHLVGPGAQANQAGNEWSWSPIGPSADTSFVLQWGGIDGAMEFTVRRQSGTWVAHADLWTGQPTTHWQPATRVEQITCPMRGA